MIEVFYESARVASLRETGQGIQLVYDPAWVTRRGAFPISMTMPLSHEPFEDGVLVPWLSNLLPETHLQQIGQTLCVAPQDILGLLAKIGRDTAGALSFGTSRAWPDRHRQVGDDAKLETIISTLHGRPLLAGTSGVSMALPGARVKLGVALIDGQIAIPVNGTPSTHILKPDVADMTPTAHNEAFCLTLAELIGLDAVRAITGRAGNRTYILVERYDRLISTGGIKLLHQEDLAQVLGTFARSRYEFSLTAEGEMRTGPGLVDMFAAVARHVGPGARLTLLDALIFNVVCGNSNAHAKNYSILIGAGGATRIAPLHDVFCASIWPSIATGLPQKLGERRIGAEVLGSDWQILARGVGLNPSHTLRAVEKLNHLIIEKAEAARSQVEAMPAGGHELLDLTCSTVVKSAQSMLERLARRRQRPRKDSTGRAQGENWAPTLTSEPICSS